MNSLRSANSSAADYARKRQRDREEAARRDEREEEAEFAATRTAWLAEQSSSETPQGTATATKPVDASIPAQPAPETPPTPQPERTQRERGAEGRKKIAKHRKIARNAVEAARKDKANAKAHADKVIARMTKEGRL